MLREYVKLILNENEEDIIDSVQAQYIDKFDNNNYDLQFYYQ
mgnify:CR=1 FL=1